MAIVDVNDSNFQNFLNENPKVIVKYYADWCGNCRLFKPKYKRLSDDERFKDIVFLYVNAEHNPQARQLAHVNNLPFFAIFKNGTLLNSVATSKEETVLELLEQLKSE
ncbi:MAG: thioredoxin family protein [Cytophagales bacterium]|nr:thioredoxin family protein [Cytophagales bacterium]MDW8384170.1 thioredoxin family protein [Flammeovirgaceae bacterium]